MSGFPFLPTAQNAVWLLSAFVLSLALTRLVLGWLRAKAVMDIPNERSSHTIPTPRGGGLAVTPVVIAGWGLAGLVSPGPVPVALWAVLAASAALYLVSWLDDRLSLSRRLRLGLHVAAAALGTLLLPETTLVFQGWLPLWADRAVTLIGWVWFINLYNFMDGIDGITGVETASIGTGLLAVSLLLPAAATLPYGLFGLTAAGAALGFLVFNWHPAKLFLGDVGSVPLGYLLGFALIVLAGDGALIAALILPAYYLLDATATLLKRLVQGKPIGQAHREHFYQQAVHHGGLRHNQVSALILVTNLCLLGAALFAISGHRLPAVAGTIAVLCVIVVLFRRRPR